MIVPATVLTILATLIGSSVSAPTGSETKFLTKRFYDLTHSKWECPEGWYMAPHPMLCDTKVSNTQKVITIPAPTSECKAGYFYSPSNGICSKLRLLSKYQYQYIDDDGKAVSVPVPFLDVDGDINKNGWWIATSGLLGADTHLSLGKEINSAASAVFGGWLDVAWDSAWDAVTQLDVKNSILRIVSAVANADTDSEAVLMSNAAGLVNQVFDLKQVESLISSLLDDKKATSVVADLTKGNTALPHLIATISPSDSPLALTTALLNGEPSINIRLLILSMYPKAPVELVNQLLEILNKGDVTNNIKLLSEVVLTTGPLKINSDDALIKLTADVKAKISA